MTLDFKRNLFFDGAMGTMLQRGFTEEEIYGQYIDAGSDILTANTFGIFDPRAVGEAVVRAKAVAGANGGQRMVALDIGPTGRLLEPYGDMSSEECRTIFLEVSKAGAKAGADLILVETMMDLEEMSLAVAAAKTWGLPVIASMTFDKNGMTSMGVNLKMMALRLEQLEVDAMGMNCGYGPELYMELLPQLVETTGRPIIVQPNAGLPEIVDGKPCYTMTPDAFAKSMAEMAGMVRKNMMLLGGCCGTTPEHIEEMIALCRG